MIKLLSLISGWTGLGEIGTKLVATGGLIATILGLWFGFAQHYENKGAAKAVAKIEQKAVALNEKGVKARASVAGVSDAAERLRKDYCDDCKPLR